ncbi:unnamed protein product [Mucor hiemalis]
MNPVPISIKQEDTTPPSKQYKTIAASASAGTLPNTASQKNVAPFVNKLYSMVNDPESDDSICWSEDGTSFFVHRQEDFARKVLPRFFKHRKFSSFVRQLNMYGFHKVPHLQQGVLETDSDSEQWEFSNPHFQRNRRDLLLLVNRKKGPDAEEKEISTVDLHHILEEIQSIKKHQMNISTQLQTIQRDNQVLWQETVAARERHHRHQETIDKILRFLASVFSNGEKRNAISRKRRYLLGPAGEHDEELSDEEHQQQSAFISEERPTKIARQNSSESTPFDLDDLVGKNDLLNLPTALPPHMKNSGSNNTSSELEDAIALNNQSKQDESNLASISDFSNITNIPQLQTLQTLITLAQSNPELLSQLTNEAFYGGGNPTPATHNYQTILPAPSTTDTSSIALPPLSAATESKSTTAATQQPRSINQVTDSISNISNTADALNHDINELGISLQALADHLGFDPTKNGNTDDKLGDEDEGELLDMDEFLNTYGKRYHWE